MFGVVEIGLISESGTTTSDEEPMSIWFDECLVGRDVAEGAWFVGFMMIICCVAAEEFIALTEGKPELLAETGTTGKLSLSRGMLAPKI